MCEPAATVAATGTVAMSPDSGVPVPVLRDTDTDATDSVDDITPLAGASSARIGEHRRHHRGDAPAPSETASIRVISMPAATGDRLPTTVDVFGAPCVTAPPAASVAWTVQFPPETTAVSVAPVPLMPSATTICGDSPTTAAAGLPAAPGSF